MGGDDFADDRQAQSGAVRLGLAARHVKESLEDARQMLRAECRTPVSDTVVSVTFEPTAAAPKA